MTDLKLILASHLSKRNEALTTNQRVAVENAIMECVMHSVDEYRANEAKAINKEAIGLIPALARGQLKLWIRNWYFARAKKQAQIMANIQNRKVYVIRSSDVAYALLSNKDVEMNKRTGLLDKNADALRLHETADYIAFPKLGKK